MSMWLWNTETRTTHWHKPRSSCPLISVLSMLLRIAWCLPTTKLSQISVGSQNIHITREIYFNQRDAYTVLLSVPNFLTSYLVYMVLHFGFPSLRSKRKWKHLITARGLGPSTLHVLSTCLVRKASLALCLHSVPDPRSQSCLARRNNNKRSLGKSSRILAQSSNTWFLQEESRA